MITDIGCEDFKKAARNREMIATKRNIIGYLQVEEALRSHSLSEPLPAWIPLGYVPRIGKDEGRYLHKYGIHIIEENFDETLQEMIHENNTCPKRNRY